MDRQAVLAAFDAQIRRQPMIVGAGGVVESVDGVVRCLSDGDGEHGVSWSGLTSADADAAIARQVARFAAAGRPWEWKHYSHDEPADLAARLRAAGFVADSVEALMVAQIADLALDLPAPDGVRLEAVRDAAAVAVLVGVHDAIFGGDHARHGRELWTGMAAQPPMAAGVVAYAGKQPIAAGRVSFHGGTDFASIWGGGTVSAWRRRGVFRTLVAHRARLAAERGFRYLQVDAVPASEVILERIGFVKLADTTPYHYDGESAKR